jgi:hypothetical protein
VRFLAVLKDSIREAVDVRVFYLLLSATLGVLLVFASMTFTPRPARDLLAGLTGPLLEAPLGPDPAVPLASFRLRGVAPLDGAPDGPASPLRFFVLVTFHDAARAAAVRQNPGPVLDSARRRFGVFGSARIFEVIDARLAAADDPALPAPPRANQVYVEADTRPTADTRRVWPYDTCLLFGAVPLGGMWQYVAHTAGPSAPDSTEDVAPPLGVQLYTFLDVPLRGLGSWAAMLASVIVTGFFVPSMLHKGTLDMLLVKPLRRWRLLVYKYLGGLAFIALNAAVAVGGVWLVLGLRAGVWCHAVLLLVPVLTFAFAVLYAVSVLVSVLTHSPVVTILITCLAWALLYGVGLAHGYYQGGPDVAKPAAPPGGQDPTVRAAVEGLYLVLPRTGDLNELARRFLERDLSPLLRGTDARPAPGAPGWGESLGVSAAFIAVLLGLACARFSTRDY